MARLAERRPFGDAGKLIAEALETPEFSPRWLWTGYLHDGEITLLTSQWKTGKTTLIAGLLRQLGAGGEFLGQPLRPR